MTSTSKSRALWLEENTCNIRFRFLLTVALCTSKIYIALRGYERLRFSALVGDIVAATLAFAIAFLDMQRVDFRTDGFDHWRVWQARLAGDDALLGDILHRNQVVIDRGTHLGY